MTQQPWIQSLIPSPPLPMVFRIALLLFEECTENLLAKKTGNPCQAVASQALRLPPMGQLMKKETKTLAGKVAMTLQCCGDSWITEMMGWNALKSICKQEDKHKP